MGKDFAEKNLKPQCSPANLDLCDADKKKQIEGFMAMSDDELNKKIQGFKDEQAALEETFKTEVKKLQETYEQLQKDKDEGAEKIKNSGLGLMSSVQAFKKKKK